MRLPSEITVRISRSVDKRALVTIQSAPMFDWVLYPEQLRALGETLIRMAEAAERVDVAAKGFRSERREYLLEGE